MCLPGCSSVCWRFSRRQLQVVYFLLVIFFCFVCLAIFPHQYFSFLTLIKFILNLYSRYLDPDSGFRKTAKARKRGEKFERRRRERGWFRPQGGEAGRGRGFTEDHASHTTRNVTSLSHLILEYRVLGIPAILWLRHKV